MERFAIKIDKNLRANLYKICRLCGIDNPDKIKVRDDKNIVNLEDGEPELWKKVFDCIGLMITKDDKMPQFMCSLCVDKINDFFEFREMCYATDVQTRKLLGIKKEPKPKTPVVAPPADLKTEDIKEPMPDITPQQRGRKRRNADLEISRDIKTDESEDIKPATTSEAATSNALKKKRMKLSTTPEAETKIEPSTKPKKEPLSKLASKLERLPKIPLSKKRLKAEPVTKVTKKDIKAAKITKLMNKKLKLETPAAAVAPEEQLQMLTKKKKELVKLRKLPQAVIKAEKLKRAVLDAKIKEETPVVPENNVATAAPSAKTTKTIKSKLQCTICDEVLINKLHLDKHVKTTHIPSVSRYHCVQCNETLKKNMEIKNHNLWHKLSKTPFKCGNCAEACCSIYTYSKHIRDCNQIAYLDSHIPDWHCPDCSGVYETTYLFNIHPCVSKGLVCPGCDKPFKWKEDYLKHIPTCGAAFHQIPPYMTSNIQVKNEAELPTSPIPPHATQALPSAATSVLVQSIPSTRIQPPQLDSTQCVVIPGNISFNEEEPGAASPSKSTRKGKRITKKDLKRFDKLLKSTMTTLVSIKHEPNLGSDYDVTAADGIQSSSTTEIKERSELTSSSPMEPRSRSGSPMAFGGDDFHHNGDDSDSADEQAPTTKPVGKIKQEIIDEGYRDLYNNIEVNIKHEVEVNKNITSEPALKPILKLKITKEHGTLNSILVDSPVSEKKKKKKKRKEDRASRLSPEKEGHTAGVKQAPNLPTPPSPTSTELVKSSLAASVEKNLSTRQNLLPEFEKSNDLQGEHLPPSMPLPEIVTIKQEIIEHDVDVAGAAAAMDEETPSQNAPSIVAASSGSLQISCVSEGVTFHDNEETEEELPQHESSTSEEPTDWATPIPSLTLSLNPVSSSASSSLDLGQVPAEVDEEEEEVDVKPRLEDLIPMLQIVSVTSGAEAVVKPVKPPAKRKRRPKANQMPKIVSVSSGSEVVSYNSETDIPAMDHVDAEKPSEGDSEEIFDFSQVKIKEEVFDSGYEKENTATSLQDEDADDDEDDNEEAEEEESVEAEDQQLVSPASKKQAEENAYIANIDFNNLNIKQEKEYIDDGMSNSVAFGDEPADELGDEDSESESEDSTSDDEDDEGSESEREYRDLPSEDEEDNESDEQLKSTAKPTEEPTEDQAPLGLQILEARSEFCSPESSTKKTESEEINSDPNERKAAMSSGTVGLEEELQSATPMEVDGHNESNQKETEIEKQIAIDREQSVSLALVDSVEHTNSESGRSLQITAPDPEEKPSSSQITDGQMEGAETAPTPSQESVLDGVLSTNNCDALPPVDGVNAEILNERLDVTNSTIDRATIEGSVPLTQVLSHSKPRAEELSSARRLIEDCQVSHTDELSFSTLPTSADNADSSTSIQSSPHLPDDLNLNCSIDGQIHSNPTENHCENDSQITNNHVEPETTSMADHEPSPYHDRQYVNPNSEFQPEAAYNIPPSTIQQGSSPATTTFTTINDQPTFGEYPDLSLPTAGQLQTSFVHNPHTSQSNASLANLSSLSEEVQNLLNEETVSVNNFEYNDCVLRARGSIAPVINPEPVPVPLPNQVVFNDFENLNEIAENNNNANIERELQDELGNVLADVIADTSNDDHQIDENNVMNENRANFDIT